jgi:diadenylate cyclase
MRPLWLHGIDILLGSVVLRAMLGWLSANPRVLKLLIPIGVASLLLLFNVYVQLPLVTMLVVFVAMPIAVLLLLSAIGEMHSFYEPATVRAMFSVERVGSQAFAPRLAPVLRQMSQERTGALIVLPRNNDVHRLLTGGEQYDAKFTPSLLLSLFNPEAPRHDGALVVEGERVTRVGAVLPLASAEGAREEWGTRHLAAVGLSENCDADVLVVSEERGTISHVRQGHLTILTAHSDEALVAELERVLGDFGPVEKRSMQPLAKSILLWAVALGVSIIASFNVDRLASRFFAKPALITSREVAINLINVPQGLFVDQLSTGKCEMLVQVPKDWFVIGNIQWPVVIDLAGYEPGQVSIQLTRDLIPKFPREWVVYRFTPERITFNLVKVRWKFLKIRPRFEGLPDGLEITDSVVKPPKVKVEIRDPEWDKQRIDTLPIDLSKIEAPGEYVLDAVANLPATVTIVEPEGKEKELSVTLSIAGTKAGSKPPP